MHIYTLRDLRKKVAESFLSCGYEKKEGKGIINDRFPNTFNPSVGDAELHEVYHHRGFYSQYKFFIIDQCLRSVDIDKVGYSQHLSLFEMATAFALDNKNLKCKIITELFDLLTKRMELSQENLIITNWAGGEIANRFIEEDKVSLNTWLNLGIKESQILVSNIQDNFLLPDGSEEFAGPRTEIFYNLTNTCPHSINPIEIATIQFLEYTTFKKADGDIELIPLTTFISGIAIGIERMSMVLQNLNSIFEIDEIKQLKDIVIAEINNNLLSYIKQPEINMVVDHIRAILRIMNEGQLPDNSPRGRIFKKLLNRLIKTTKALGLTHENSYKKILNYLISVYSYPSSIIDNFFKIFLGQNGKNR